MEKTRYFKINPNSKSQSTSQALQKILEEKLQQKEDNYMQENQGNKKFHTGKKKKWESYTNTQHHQHKNIMNEHSLVTNISQHQWTQFPNKKTQANRMDEKTGYIILLHPRNTV
jgi:hypothetical protein